MASLLIVVPPWPLPLALPPQAEYLAMGYPSKLLTLLASRPGTAPPQYRVGKSAVVSSPSLRSDAPSVASGTGILRPARALPHQLQHECPPVPVTPSLNLAEVPFPSRVVSSPTLRSDAPCAALGLLKFEAQ